MTRDEQYNINGELTGIVGDFLAVKHSGTDTANAQGQGVPQIALAADPATDHFAGVVYEGGAVGESVSIARSGVVEMIAGAAITRGTHRWITYDASGEAIPLVAGSGDECIGEAVFRNGLSIANGDCFLVDLDSAKGFGSRAVFGLATILIGTASIAVTVPTGYNGDPVHVTLNQTAEDTTSLRFWAEWTAATTITIRTNANSTAAVVVAYSID